MATAVATAAGAGHDLYVIMLGMAPAEIPQKPLDVPETVSAREHKQGFLFGIADATDRAVGVEDEDVGIGVPRLLPRKLVFGQLYIKKPPRCAAEDELGVSATARTIGHRQTRPYELTRAVLLWCIICTEASCEERQLLLRDPSERTFYTATEPVTRIQTS